MNTVAVIGLGEVGRPVADLASLRGMPTIGIDINTLVVDLFNDRGPNENPVLRQALASGALEATTDYARVSDADTIVVCVPTPLTEDMTPDFSPLRSAAMAIAPRMKKGALIVLESTVNAGVTRDFFVPILEEGSGLSAGLDFSIAHCPERIDPGNEKWPLRRVNRVVGGLTEECLSRALAFYSAMLDESAEITPVSSLEVAEMSKINENSQRFLLAVHAAEISMGCDAVGISSAEVRRASMTKPYGYVPMMPNPGGVGGQCLGVDTRFGVLGGQKRGYEHRVLETALYVNESMARFSARQIVHGLHAADIPVRKARILVMGLTYKIDHGGLYESGSLKIAKALKEWDLSEIVGYDPLLLDHEYAQIEKKYGIRLARDLDTALERCDAVALTMAHTSLVEQLSPKKLADFNIKMIFDGWERLSRQDFEAAHIVYCTIGRVAPKPERPREKLAQILEQQEPAPGFIVQRIEAPATT